MYEARTVQGRVPQGLGVLRQLADPPAPLTIKSMVEKLEQKTIRYGIQLNQLTEQLLKKILMLYEQIIGGQGVRLYALGAAAPSLGQKIQEIRERLKISNAVDLRYGSRLITQRGREDQDAKLVIWMEKGNTEDDMIIRFSFDPNVIKGASADNLKREFEQAINNLLIDESIAIKL